MERSREAVIWCPECHAQYGEVWREQIPGKPEGHYRHVAVPGPLPKYCTRCDTILERKR